MASCQWANPFVPTHSVALALILSVVSLSLGFYVGTHDHTILKGPQTTSTNEETDQDGGLDEDLSAIQAGILDTCKLTSCKALVVRTDLKMAPGKTAAQCSGVTLACYNALIKRNPKLVRHWEHTGQAKVTLKAKSEEQILELEAVARSLNLCARSMIDLDEGTSGVRTVLGIGPAPVQLVNQVTGKLRLL